LFQRTLIFFICYCYDTVTQLNRHKLSNNSLGEVTIFPEKNKKGEFAILQKKKKREIIQEGENQVEIPPEVGDEEEKALNQTGDDATSGW
jgi:hypothetical protein